MCDFNVQWHLFFWVISQHIDTKADATSWYIYIISHTHTHIYIHKIIYTYIYVYIYKYIY